jgi:hypothetical protein
VEFNRCSTVKNFASKDDTRPYQLILATKNVKHRDSGIRVNNIDLHSIKFHC